MCNRMRKKGEITVFVSLLLAVLLFFFQACLKSAQMAYFRSQAQEALELAEYSVLSEYHKELWERYRLFYLDLGYGKGNEDAEYFKARLRGFLEENLPQGKVEELKVGEISRATDGRGLAYYEQAVSCMKQKMGVSLLEQFGEYETLGQQAVHLEEDYASANQEEQENLEDLRRRREEEEETYTPNPVSDIQSLGRGSILNLVLRDPSKISGKKAELSQSPSVRNCRAGAGPRGKYGAGAGNDVFFHAYLLEYHTNAVDFLAEKKETSPWLDYQMEYLIAGKDADIENLESICGRILALREGLNYAYLLTDGAKVAECEALAIALVGATLIPGLVEAVKQVLLLGWAFAESVLDVRMLLNGKRQAFWKSADTWKLSLEGALNLGDSLSGFDNREDDGGLVYKDYLGILLSVTGREKKTMRSLDVIEGVIRGGEGGKGFFIDQCTDSFWMETSLWNGQELSAKRWFCYEW